MELISGTIFAIMLITVILYYTLPKKAKPYVLLLISIVVYASFGKSSIFFIIFSTVTTYLAGILLEKTKYRKTILAITIIINTLILVILKNGLFVKDIIIPIGISYYTFQVISYIIDIYRKKYEPQKNIAKYFRCKTNLKRPRPFLTEK